MAHIVKCAICGLQFDRDKVRCVKHGARRYSHFQCEPDGELVVPEISQEDLDKQELYNYIIEKHGLQSTGPQINKQIKQYHDECGYTYSGMLKSLKYWYEVKNAFDPRFKDTVSIIGKVYNQAKDYYYALYLTQLQNKDKNISDFIAEEKEITIPVPQQIYYLRTKLFNLDDDEEDA